MNYFGACDLLKLMRTIPVVDVRSPGEYNHGHISPAINIPLFNDEERAEIGILYTQSGREEAMKRGMEIVRPKMDSLVREAQRSATGNQLLVHCWRGGMRSEKMAGLFESAGMECLVLSGGYKAFRTQLFLDFDNLGNLIVIHGPTGCGKTEILKELENTGEQVINLEFHANHRGSAFGSIGLRPQPTTMQFQNDVHYQLMKIDMSRFIWIEGESLNVGKVYLPNTLWNTMNRSIVVKIEMPKNLRVERIVKEYGMFPTGELTESVKVIEKRFGGDRALKVLDLIHRNCLSEAVEMLLDYYDEHYDFSLDKYKSGRIIEIKTNSADASVNAGLILSKLKETVNYV